MNSLYLNNNLILGLARSVFPLENNVVQPGWFVWRWEGVKSAIDIFTSTLMCFRCDEFFECPTSLSSSLPRFGVLFKRILAFYPAHDQIACVAHEIGRDWVNNRESSSPSRRFSEPGNSNAIFHEKFNVRRRRSRRLRLRMWKHTGACWGYFNAFKMLPSHIHTLFSQS